MNYVFCNKSVNIFFVVCAEMSIISQSKMF